MLKTRLLITYSARAGGAGEVVVTSVGELGVGSAPEGTRDELGC